MSSPRIPSCSCLEASLADEVLKFQRYGGNWSSASVHSVVFLSCDQIPSVCSGYWNSKTDTMETDFMGALRMSVDDIGMKDISARFQSLES